MKLYRGEDSSTQPKALKERSGFRRGSPMDAITAWLLDPVEPGVRAQALFYFAGTSTRRPRSGGGTERIPRPRLNR